MADAHTVAPSKETSTEELHELLAIEIAKRVALEVQVQDAKMYAAALEHRINSTASTVEEVEATLLRELMVYKRRSLSEHDAHIFKSSIRNALNKEVNDGAELRAYQQRHAAQVASLQKKCAQLEGQLEDKAAAMNAMDMRNAESERLTALKHDAETRALMVTITTLKSQLSNSSGRRLLERAGLAKDKLLALRDAVHTMRATVVEFQQHVGDGILTQRSGSLRMGRAASIAGRRGSVAPNSPDRWRKASITANVVAAFSSRSALSRQSSSVTRQSGVHFTPTTDVEGGAHPSDGGGHFADIARSESMVTHVVAHEAHSSTPGSVTISPPFHDTSKSVESRPQRSLLSAGGLMAKSMKALQSVNGNFDTISKRLEEVYKPICALEEAVQIQQERYYVKLAPVESILDLSPTSTTDAGDRVESFTRALLEVLQQLRERERELQVSVKVLESDKIKLTKECAELKVRIPPPTVKESVSTVTTIDASNWEYLVKGDVALLHASQLALQGGGSVRPTPTLGLESPRSAVGSARANSINAHHRTPSALDAMLASSHGMNASAPAGLLIRRASLEALKSPSKANDSLRMDDLPDAPDQPLWASPTDPQDSADNHVHLGLKRRCLITWLTQYHNRKQRALDAFLEKRVAPVFGIHLSSTARKAITTPSQRPSSARRSNDDNVPTIEAPIPATLCMTSLCRPTSAGTSNARPRPPTCATSGRKRGGGPSHWTQRPFSASVALPQPLAAVDKPDLDWIREGRLEMRRGPTAVAPAPAATVDSTSTKPNVVM